MELSEQETKSSKWILLAEDDKLFTILFLRFWGQHYPHIEVRTASSNQQVRQLLEAAQQEPSIAILDLNLEDGPSKPLQEQLTCPTWLWSSSRTSGCRVKPSGRRQLTDALADIAELGRLDVPSE